MDDLEKVRAELARYEHALLVFGVVREANGELALTIDARMPLEGYPPYRAPIHAREVEHPQFAWHFQRYLYDCMHDFLVDLFLKTPQSEGARP